MAVPPVFVSGQILTAAQMNAIGLWEIQTASFTTSSAETYTCFTSDYDNYRIVLTITAMSSTNADIAFQLGNSGTFANTNYGYFSSFVLQNSTQGIWLVQNFNASGHWMIQGGGDKMPAVCDMTMFGPFLARETRTTSNHYISYLTSGVQTRALINLAGGHGTSTSYSQLRIAPNTGTMTGSISIYGMRP